MPWVPTGAKENTPGLPFLFSSAATYYSSHMARARRKKGNANAQRASVLASKSDPNLRGNETTPSRPRTESEEERELEEACAKWCQRIVMFFTFVPMFLSFVDGSIDWITRPPMSVRMEDLNGQVYVLTGGSGGVGKRLAVELAKSNASTIIVGLRNMSGSKSLEEAILAKSGRRGQTSVFTVPLALNSFESVRSFAQAVVDLTDHKVDALIHAAGSAQNACTKTEDELESVLQVNFLSPFLLTNLLAPALRSSPGGARVVYLSCEAAYRGVVVDFNDLSGDHGSGDGGQSDYSIWTFLMRAVGFWGGDGGKCIPIQQYRNSKLLLTASAVYASEKESSVQTWQRRSKGSRKSKRKNQKKFPLTYNVVDPGSIETEFWRKADLPSMRKRRSFNPIARIFGYLFGWLPSVLPSTKRTAIRGAHAVYHVATSKHLRTHDGFGGKYFSDKGGPFTGCSRSPSLCGTHPLPRLARAKLFRSRVHQQAIKLTTGYRDPLLSVRASKRGGAINNSEEDEIESQSIDYEKDADEDFEDSDSLDDFNSDIMEEESSNDEEEEWTITAE